MHHNKAHDQPPKARTLFDSIERNKEVRHTAKNNKVNKVIVVFIVIGFNSFCDFLRR